MLYDSTSKHKHKVCFFNGYIVSLVQKHNNIPAHILANILCPVNEGVHKNERSQTAMFANKKRRCYINAEDLDKVLNLEEFLDVNLGIFIESYDIIAHKKEEIAKKYKDEAKTFEVKFKKSKKKKSNKLKSVKRKKTKKRLNNLEDMVKVKRCYNNKCFWKHDCGTKEVCNVPICISVVRKELEWGSHINIYKKMMGWI